MPAQYERIKESYLKRGKPLKEAKRIAAATYNKHHKSDPVGPGYDARHSLIHKSAAKKISGHMAKRYAK